MICATQQQPQGQGQNPSKGRLRLSVLSLECKAGEVTTGILWRSDVSGTQSRWLGASTVHGRNQTQRARLRVSIYNSIDRRPLERACSARSMISDFDPSSFRSSSEAVFEPLSVIFSPFMSCSTTRAKSESLIYTYIYIIIILHSEQRRRSGSRERTERQTGKIKCRLGKKL